MPPVSLETAYGPYRDDFMAAARLVGVKKKAGQSSQYHSRRARSRCDTGRGRGEVHGTLRSHLYPIVRHAPCPVLSI
jgi:hypothetical protein